ncbi:CPBP family intramembrane metalloprotease [bacterium]|nr:CPBP family intramembrane metalloprotease [bacterium]
MNVEQTLSLLNTYLLADIVLIPLAWLTWRLLRRVVFSRLETAPRTLYRPVHLQFAGGFGLGLACVLTVVGLIAVAGGYAVGPGWQPFSYRGQPPDGWQVWGMLTVQSLCEELLFRAIGMVLLAVLIFWLARFVLLPSDPARQARWHLRLWLASGLAANLVVSIGFAVVHLRNPAVTPFAAVNVALAGLVLGQLCWMQGTPIGAWGWHWIWNAGLATLGLPVSGIMLNRPLVDLGISGARAGVISGGLFGPEGSVMTSIVLLSLLVAMLLLQIGSMQSSRLDNDSIIATP